MAVLSDAQRRRLPPAAFAIPAARKYPIPDRAHARAALARCAHDCSPSERHQVRAAIDRRFPGLRRRTR